MTNSPTLEQIARAICKSRTCEGINCCQWPSQGGRTKCPVKMGLYDDAAKDVLALIKPPQEFPIITQQWVDEGCEKAYIQCMEQVAEIQKAAQKEAEPWVRRAVHFQSIGARPVFIGMAKP